MADYTYPTGSGGTMMIRDQGYNIEFWVQSGQSATFGNGLPWNGYVNGVSVGGTFNYSSGRPWVHIATYGVGYNQQVRFSLGNTGTSGLGGPTNFYLNISRATVPAPPTPLPINQSYPSRGHTQFLFQFSGNSNGGAAILEWQIGYGYSPSTVQFTMPSSGTSTIVNLKVGSTVYVWARGRNSVGWSGWSTRSNVTLLPGGWVKVNGVWMTAIPFVKLNGAWVGAIPYIKKAGAWTLAGGS